MQNGVYFMVAITASLTNQGQVSLGCRGLSKGLN